MFLSACSTAGTSAPGRAVFSPAQAIPGFT
jgi:hypothetical protein